MILAKHLWRQRAQLHHLSTCNPLLNTVTAAERLDSRKVLRIQGEDTFGFLQGLITNDLHHLHQGQTSIYAMFLNKAGRVLYDTIIYRAQEDLLFLDCDYEVAQLLRNHLLVYRIRKKVTIDNVSDEYRVWAIYGASKDLKPDSASVESVFAVDPRSKDLGMRVVTNLSDEEVLKSHGIDSKANPEISYRRHRYKLGISEGVSEIVPGKAFPLEVNLDYLNGLSVHKGCYLGQEFTARTYHTGVVRKRVMPISIDAKSRVPLNEDVKSGDGKSVGKVRGVDGSYGIALMRIEQALAAKELKVGTSIITTGKPLWWPQEAINPSLINWISGIIVVCNWINYTHSNLVFFLWPISEYVRQSFEFSLFERITRSCDWTISGIENRN